MKAIQVVAARKAFAREAAIAQGQRSSRTPHGRHPATARRIVTRYSRFFADGLACTKKCVTGLDGNAIGRIGAGGRIVFGFAWSGGAGTVTISTLCRGVANDAIRSEEWQEGGDQSHSFNNTIRHRQGTFTKRLTKNH